MKFYIAGKARHGEANVTDIGEALVARGHTWLLDWTKLPVKKPYVLHADENRATATQMLEACREADLVIFLWSEDVYGALIEIGAALASGATIVLVGEVRDSIFWSLYAVERVIGTEGLLKLLDGHEAAR